MRISSVSSAEVDEESSGPSGSENDGEEAIRIFGESLHDGEREGNRLS